MRLGSVAGYAAAVIGALYAALSLYWGAGGTYWLDTVGGAVRDLAGRGGTSAVTVGLGAAALKLAASAVAFVLARTGGRLRWLLILAALIGFVLIVYGGVLVAVGALVLTGAMDPGTAIDRTALTWHVAVWDLWFLVWGVLFALATIAFRRRSPVVGSRV
ncbi:DUF3995 domain-containing protein [Amycolatopsis cynarae]|uniref:DUF3995 domain-containing protein n=1 Tax=Amycolatopsis cynarae TaxID=2995223 RepID=A0ABY7AY43_9PSEU|nr:DUF3995 domain-containing protein [Amycolatopsis sp. HUAS 11-8]WAL63943.1 DUF3995 domain-containing protein [Amycolatopsis sp. HUAS 11-8]